ncbi:Hal9p SCDLUD_005097 [Saccharomycodes ludwigii]|uniref:Hal9p n=1 Tax=Saccharomycodes ludwigii TaxID=36035 RepID=UPI001E85543A|nr:hypothetical protein SCDLUD_005097 [Saccharomycodes ludwigii]KAH3898762.1 hypothetical protein SCDLUD_005097 [Saccharomycodes ludwigii]
MSEGNENTNQDILPDDDLTLQSIKSTKDQLIRVNRPRAIRACDNCRRRKIKCSDVDVHTGKCSNCVKLAMDCTFHQHYNSLLKKQVKRKIKHKRESIEEIRLRCSLEKEVVSVPPNGIKNNIFLNAPSIDVGDIPVSTGSSDSSLFLNNSVCHRLSNLESKIGYLTDLVQKLTSGNNNNNSNDNDSDNDGGNSNSNSAAQRTFSEKKTPEPLNTIKTFGVNCFDKSGYKFSKAYNPLSCSFVNTFLIEELKHNIYIKNGFQPNIIKPLYLMRDVHAEYCIINFLGSKILNLLNILNARNKVTNNNPLQMTFELPSLNKCKRLIEIFKKEVISHQFNLFGETDVEGLAQDYHLVLNNRKNFSSTENVDTTNTAFHPELVPNLLLLNITLCIGAYVFRCRGSDDLLIRKDKLIITSEEIRKIEIETLYNSFYYYKIIDSSFDSWETLKGIFMLYHYCNSQLNEDISHEILMKFLYLCEKMNCHVLRPVHKESTKSFMLKKYFWFLGYCESLGRSLKFNETPIMLAVDADVLTDYAFSNIIKVWAHSISVPDDVVAELEALSDVDDCLKVCLKELRLFPIYMYYYMAQLYDIASNIHLNFFSGTSLLNIDFDSVIDKYFILEDQLLKWRKNLPDFLKIEQYRQLISNLFNVYSDELNNLKYTTYVKRILSIHIEYNYLHCLLNGFILRFINDNKGPASLSRHDILKLIQNSKSSLERHSINNLNALEHLDVMDLTNTKSVYSFFFAFVTIFFMVMGEVKADKREEYLSFLLKSFNTLNSQFKKYNPNHSYNGIVCYIYSFVTNAISLGLMFNEYNQYSTSKLYETCNFVDKDLSEASATLRNIYKNKKLNILNIAKELKAIYQTYWDTNAHIEGQLFQDFFADLNEENFERVISISMKKSEKWEKYKIDELANEAFVRLDETIFQIAALLGLTI